MQIEYQCRQMPNGVQSCWIVPARTVERGHLEPPSPTAKLQQFANAYWIYGVVLVFWMACCLILRTTGRTDMTEPLEYDYYDTHHQNDEDDE